MCLIEIAGKDRRKSSFFGKKQKLEKVLKEEKQNKIVIIKLAEKLWGSCVYMAEDLCGGLCFQKEEENKCQQKTEKI